MPNTFHYSGRDINGNVIDGDVEANNVDEVVQHLKKDNIIPINIAQTKASFVNFHNFLKLTKKIETYSLMILFRQLATLVDAGLPLIKAINRLAQSATSKALSTVLERVANDITAGLSLSEALKKHPEVFSTLTVSIIDIGENTGKLSESLRYLSNYLETSIANTRRLLSAIRYPMFVVTAIVAAIVVLNFMVIPKFSFIFSRFNLELPLATRIIMGTSTFMLTYKLWLAIGVVLLIFGIPKLLKIPSVHFYWDKYKLRAPVFGALQKRIIISQFTWTFSLILRSGVPIIKGMGLASAATSNAYFSAQLEKMTSAIEHGESLSRAAIASGLFTPITIQMIEVGEESEKLDEALSEVAKYYDTEIDYDLKRLNELLEPILLAVLGIVITIIAIGIYFPMWDLIKVAKV